MWIINGVEPSTGRVRQHDDLSYWMSDEEIVSALGADIRSDDGPWAITQAMVSTLEIRRRSGIQANFDRDIGALEFLAEHREDWETLVSATWFDDEAESPGDPVVAARAHGRDVVWHLEGFDRVRLFMVEDFELSHRISEAEILAALLDPPAPYYDGLPPTAQLVDLVVERIGLRLRLDQIDYQVNMSSRYGIVGQSTGFSG
jgi:hypothetical protein